MPRRTSTGSSRVMSRSPMKMRPLVGSMSRFTIFMVVVLPQPDGPTSTQTSPSGTSRFRWSTATLPSNTLVTSSSRITRQNLLWAAVTAIFAANGPKSWIWWKWIGDHFWSGRNLSILDATREHVELTLIAVGIGLLISLPLAVLAWRFRWLDSPVLGAPGLIYPL